MGAGTLDDVSVGIDQRIGLAGERRDFDGEFTLQSFRAAGPDVGDRI